MERSAKVYACLLFACSINMSLLRADDLLNAIDRADVYEVKRLLNSDQFANNSHEYKERIRKAVYESVNIAQKATQKFRPRGYDLFRVYVGRGLLGLSSVAAFFVVSRAVIEGESAMVLPALGAAGVSGLIGLNQIYKGLTHYSARKHLAQAREIEALVSSQQIGQQ